MDQPSSPGVAGRTTQGAAWLIGARLLVRCLDFLLLLCLGRLLGPADFGLIAIAMTLITVVEAVLELPLIQSLISMPRLSRVHLDTAFSLGLLRGLVLTGLLGLLAWPFASFYATPQLLPIVAVLSLAPAMRSLSSPAMAVYARQISFHRDFILEVAGKLISFVIAVTIAFATRSYWALVANSVLTPACATALSYVIAPYRPRLTLAKWHAFVDFLGWNTAAQLVNAINWQCDRFLISRHTSRATLGEFSMASDLSALPVQALLVPILRPLTAAFAVCRDEPARVAAAYQRTVATLLAVVTPVMVGLSALAEPAVQLVLGPKWGASAAILRWLAPVMLANCFVTPLGALTMALGRTQVWFRQGSIEFCVKIPLVIAGVLLAGIPGVIAARVATALLTSATAMFQVRRLCGLAVLQQLAQAVRFLASGTVMYLVLTLLQRASGPASGTIELVLRLPLFGGIGLLCYAASALLFWHLSGRPSGAERTALRMANRMLDMPLLRRRAAG